MEEEKTEIEKKVEEPVGEPKVENEAEPEPVAEPAKEAEPVADEALAENPIEPAEGAEDAGGKGEPAPELPEANAEDAPLEGNPTSEEPQPEAEKTFTQEQVNKMAGKSREEGRKAGYKAGYEAAKAELLSKYGVDNDDELDSIFADGSRYGEQSARFDDMSNRLRDSETTVALMKVGVLPERYGDVKAILSANGLDVTEEAIRSMLPTHGEWVANKENAPVAPAPEIPQPKPATAEGEQPKENASGVMGVEPNASAGPEESEEDLAMKLYGLKK